MSSPETNMSARRQTRRHWPSLLGMALVVAFGVAATLWWVRDAAVVEAPVVTQPDAAQTSPAPLGASPTGDTPAAPLSPPAAPAPTDTVRPNP
jgi:hypothetical protein